MEGMLGKMTKKYPHGGARTGRHAIIFAGVWVDITRLETSKLGATVRSSWWCMKLLLRDTGKCLSCEY